MLDGVPQRVRQVNRGRVLIRPPPLTHMAFPGGCRATGLTHSEGLESNPQAIQMSSHFVALPLLRGLPFPLRSSHQQR